jgi:hypothetical protein
MARKPTETVHLKLRFDEKLRRKIEAAATKNDQSMNAEIIQRLEESFRMESIKEVVYTSAVRAMRPLSEWVEEQRRHKENKS